MRQFVLLQRIMRELRYERPNRKIILGAWIYVLSGQYLESSCGLLREICCIPSCDCFRIFSFSSLYRRRQRWGCHYLIFCFSAELFQYREDSPSRALIRMLSLLSIEDPLLGDYSLHTHVESVKILKKCFRIRRCLSYRAIINGGGRVIRWKIYNFTETYTLLVCRSRSSEVSSFLCSPSADNLTSVSTGSSSSADFAIW